MTVNFQKQFEELSKLTVSQEDTIDDVLRRLGHRIGMCLHVERVNIWLFKNDPNRIECIANVDSRYREFSKGEVLLEKTIPSYFSHLASDKTIQISNVYEDEISVELKDNYCVDHHIFSIMDIPVRIQGKLAGVICFEDCKNTRNWKEEEVNFAMAVSQIVSLSIENFKRRAAEEKLKKALEEKNTLLVEMHHRLKNNLTMLVSLLRLQSRSIEDSNSMEIFNNVEQQILSISKLHEQLYTSGNYLNVNLDSYLKELINGFKYNAGNAYSFDLQISSFNVKSEKAVSIGLIVNEVISNSIKNSLKTGKNTIISILLEEKTNHFILKISDNGSGFNLTDELRSSFGLGLIYDLSEQLNADVQFKSNESGTSYTFTFERQKH